MVDVGYNINGKKSVIKNVTPIANTVTNHLIFANVANDEQYAIKKEYIEYVIPSSIDCVTVHDEDEVAENAIKEALSMTNEEKFIEVFGFKPDTVEIQNLCDLMSDSDCARYMRCQDCPMHCHNKWGDKWVKVERVYDNDRW